MKPHELRQPTVIKPSPAAVDIINAMHVEQLLTASALNQREGGNHVREGVSFRLPAPSRRLSFIGRLRRWLGF